MPNFNTTIKSPIAFDSPVYNKAPKSISSNGKRTIHKDIKSPEK